MHGSVAWFLLPVTEFAYRGRARIYDRLSGKENSGMFLNRERAQGMVEYGLIIAFVAVLAIAGLIIFGPAVSRLLSRLGGAGLAPTRRPGTPRHLPQRHRRQRAAPSPNCRPHLGTRPIRKIHLFGAFFSTGARGTT